MPFHVILESATRFQKGVNDNLMDIFELLNAQRDIICLNYVSRAFMDAIVCPLLHEGYGYVYVECGNSGICTAWRKSVFEATNCHTFSPQYADEPFWNRVLSFFTKKSQTPPKVSFVRLHQINTSREIWVIHCGNVDSNGSQSFITNPHFFNILVGRIVDQVPCILAGTFGNNTHTDLTFSGWVDACRKQSVDTSDTPTIMCRGGLIQIQETKGGYNSVLAQFY